MLSVSKGTSNEDLSNMNQTLIIQYLQRHGVCTRAQISKALGLTQASLSKITALLIEQGIVEETGYLSGEKGRRSVGIHLCPDQKKVIGVKLSRTNYSIGVFDLVGNCIGSSSEQFTEKTELSGIFSRIRDSIHHYQSQYPDVRAIGMAVPGPFLKKEGTILLITEMADQSGENIPIREAFDSAQFGNVPVIIRHDANSGALAEWWFSPTNHHGGTLIHFLVGEGVGAGITNHGVVMEGSLGIAGEIGHVSIDVNGERCRCGNYGCLEMYCSSVAFVKNALKKRSQHPESSLNRIPTLTTERIFIEARNGDPLSLALTEEAARYIGYGVVNLINCYDPNVIVISNEMAHGGQMILKTVREVVQERILPRIAQNVTIEISDFQNDPILYGAAAVAIDYCLSNPSSLTTAIQ